MTKKLEHILDPFKKELQDTQNLINKTILGENLFSTFQGISLEGKKLRPALAFLSQNILCNKTDSKTLELAAATELIHLASLIHDDIIDEATHRRQNPSLNVLKGNKTAVIAGDFILAKALSLLAKIKEPKIIEVFACSMENLCKGELFQKEKLWQVPSFEEYIEKSKNKTANLFIATMKSGAILAKSDNKNIEDYALNYGIAFQIKDDLLNIENNSSDFENGIFTLPAIYTIEEKPFLTDNLDKLKNEITNSSLLKTQEAIKKYTNKAIEALNSFEDSLYKTTLIEIANYNIERKS